MRSKLKRRLLWGTGTLFSLVILFAILIALLPSMIKWYANGWLEDQGVASTIEDIELKLFDGQFRVKAVQVTSPEKQKMSMGEFFIQVHLRDLMDNKLTIEKIQFSDLYVDVYQQKGKPAVVGGVSLASNETVDEKEIKTDTEAQPWEIAIKDIDFNNVETCVKLHNQQGKPMYNNCLELGDFAWDGQTSYRLDALAKDPAASLGVDLSFVLKDLRLRDVADASDVVSIDALHIKKLAMSGLSDISVGSLQIDNYHILQRAEQKTKNNSHIASIEHITLSNVDMKNLNELNIKDVNIDGFQTYFQRNKDGKLEPVLKAHQLLLPETTNDAVKDEKDKKQQPEQKKAAVIKIENLTLGGNSRVTINDSGIKPAFADTISDIKVKLSNLNSSRQDNRSPVNLSLVIGEHGKINFDGDIAFFAKRPTATLKGELKAVNLASLSAYLNSTIQHHVNSGQIDAEINLKVNNGQLDSEFDLVLHKFYIEALSEKEARAYKESLGIPLSTALSLLREKDDSIRLKLPVTGDVDNPNFSLDDIILKVVTDAVKSAVINYYTPFGLVTLTTAAFDLATALRFDPVLFEPAKIDFDESFKQQLEKLVTLLGERPNIKLVVCGYATLDDRFSLYPVGEELEKKVRAYDPDDEENPIDISTLLPKLTDKQRTTLDTLALQRGDRVRDYLVTDKAIDPSRMIMCKPRFNNDEGKPRVEVSI